MSLTPRLDRLDKNYIINGNFDFWQRGTSFVVTGYTYTADRFGYGLGGSTATRTVARSTDVPNNASQYSYSVTVGTADATVGASDFEEFYHAVEGNVLKGLYNKNVTFSFWVKSSVTGTFSINFRSASPNRMSYVTTYNINSANTWERKVINFYLDTSTGTWNSDNQVGLIITWPLMAGSTYSAPSPNTWHLGNYNNISGSTNFMANAGAEIKISQVQLIEGTYTDPEFTTAGRNYAEELELCQRYYEILSYGQQTHNVVFRSANNLGYINIPYIVEKRSMPNMIFQNNGNWQLFDGTTGITLATGVTSVRNTVLITTTNIAIPSFSSGYALLMNCNVSNTLPVVSADAEL